MPAEFRTRHARGRRVRARCICTALMSAALAMMIPASAAEVIESKADAALFDIQKLADDIAFSQHSLVPVLHQFEALCGEPAAGYIHWGATTQNIFDTTVSVQMAKTHRLLLKELDATIASLSTLALAHKATPMAGRTHGQHALPMTFGYRVAGWIDDLDRQRTRLARPLPGS